MEIIKKTILQSLTTGTTSGCTGSCRVIIPNLNAFYHIKICLIQEANDFGFFDADIFENDPYGFSAPIGINNLL